MTQEQIKNKVEQIIAEQMALDANDFKPESIIAEDLGADSLDMVEMIMALEEEFGIEIPDEKADQIATIQDVINCVIELRK